MKKSFCFFVFKKKTIVAIMLIIYTAVILISAALVPEIVSVNNGADEFSQLKILLDAGHGGVDGGAVSPIDGTVEKNLNLSVSIKVKHLFKLMGISVDMTRDTDKSIHDDFAKTIRQKKVSDLKNRLKMLEDGDYDLLFSVHMNIFSQSKYSGTQVFYGGVNEQSEVLAKCVQSSVKENLQPNNERVIKRSDKSIYLLYNSSKPVAMAECGFLSNPEELQNLKLEKYQRSMALCLANGVIQYKYGKNRKES